MYYIDLIIAFGLTAIAVGLLQWNSIRHLHRIPLVMKSPRALKVFSYSRLIYWYIFAVMITAFVMGMIMFDAGGNQTRQIIAYKANGGANAPTLVIEELSSIFIPIIFLSLFTAMASLGVIGRGVLQAMPKEQRPSEEFTRFRFTFVMLSLSLVLPPLLFGSLLLV